MLSEIGGAQPRVQGPGPGQGRNITPLFEEACPQALRSEKKNKGYSKGPSGPRGASAGLVTAICHLLEGESPVAVLVPRASAPPLYPALKNFPEFLE